MSPAVSPVALVSVVASVVACSITVSVRPNRLPPCPPPAHAATAAASATTRASDTTFTAIRLITSLLGWGTGLSYQLNAAVGIFHEPLVALVLVSTHAAGTAPRCFCEKQTAAQSRSTTPRAS